MNQKQLLFLYGLALAVLILRLVFFFSTQPPLHDGEHIAFTTRLQQEPTIQGDKQQLGVKTTRAEQVFITTDNSQSFSYGQKLQITGIVLAKVLPTHRIWTMYYPKITVQPEATSGLTTFAASIRSKSRTLFEHTLPSPSGELLMGIVFGSKETFTKQFQNSLQTAGVLHVIAASGMNVSFVIEVVLVLFGLFLRRQVAVLAAILAILFYTLLVGFEGSIMRAAIMGLFGCSAAFLGRQQWGVFALLLTGYIMLMLSPGTLLDVGFQLSFLATLGILVLQPLLFATKNLLTADVATTTSAQLATLPILIGTFGKYGLLSVVVNALVLWTIPILMILGTLAVVFSFVFYPFAQGITYLSLPFLWFFEKVVEILGGVPLVLSLTDVPVAMWLGYYVISFAVVIGLRKRQIIAAAKETD